MRKAKKRVILRSVYLNTSKSLFWPNLIIMARADVEWMQSTSRAIGVQRQRELLPITINFTGINDHVHSRGLLSSFREPTTPEAAMWPAIKDILYLLGEIMVVLQGRGFQKITPRSVFVLFPGYAHLPNELKFVYAMVALLSDLKI